MNELSTGRFDGWVRTQNGSAWLTRCTWRAIQTQRCERGFWWLGAIVLFVATSFANEARGQYYCPAGYPVDCGSYCCESGGVCYNGGCNAPEETQYCPTGYPVDCGSYCCESGGVCYNGGCNAPTETEYCPTGYPVDCGTHCCENGATCTADGCAAPEEQVGVCPDGYPLECSTFCCPSGTSCGSDGTCLRDFGPDSEGYEACPSSHPLDCGTGYCCPYGTTCDGSSCLDNFGTSVNGSAITCGSSAVPTDSGSCNFDFCFADYEDGSCEQYYVVEGGRINCGSCADSVQSCARQAAEACLGGSVPAGSGSTPGGDSSDDSNEDEGGCNIGIASTRLGVEWLAPFLSLLMRARRRR